MAAALPGGIPGGPPGGFIEAIAAGEAAITAKVQQLSLYCQVQADGGEPGRAKLPACHLALTAPATSCHGRSPSGWDTPYCGRYRRNPRSGIAPQSGEPLTDYET